MDKIKKTDKAAKVVWFSRLDCFKPNPEVVGKYRDLLRRFGTNPNAKKFALQGSNYDANYRMMINRDSKSVGKMRELATLAKTEPVYLVVENDLPDVGIIMDMVNIMVGAGVW